jgi:hypothetical protein
MAVQASPARRTRASTRSPAPARSRSNGTGRSTAPAKRAASHSVDQGRRVASRATAESQRVANRAVNEGQDVARTARSQSQAVARAAAGGAREVAETAKEQAAVVRDELAAQGRAVAMEARSKLEAETELQTRRAAGGLARLAEETRALAEGRPEDAPTLRDFVADGADRLVDVADRVAGLADEIQVKGIDGVVTDVTRFARRRPATFLLAAAVAGFGVGRLVRATGDDGSEDEYEYGQATEPRAVGRSRPALSGPSARNGARTRAAR